MTVYFDKSSIHWDDNNEVNQYFLNHQMDYIRDLVKYRGYVYLNQIHEILGVEWEPKYENHCIENADFTVVIGWDDNQRQWTVDIY